MVKIKMLNNKTKSIIIITYCPLNRDQQRGKKEAIFRDRFYETMKM